MATVNLKEARKRLGELVSAVERGESVLITRRGKEVARLGPVVPETRQHLPELSEFRASIAIKGRSLSGTVIAMRAEERY